MASSTLFLIHRDIDFINAHCALFKAKLLWDAHRQSYFLVKLSGGRQDGKTAFNWLKDHIELEHPDIDNKTWESVILALAQGKGLQFDYHNVQMLLHKTGVRLAEPRLRQDKGEWYISGAEGEEGAWNMRYITGLRTF
jgi:hypothetical protein